MVIHGKRVGMFCPNPEGSVSKTTVTRCGMWNVDAACMSIAADRNFLSVRMRTTMHKTTLSVLLLNCSQSNVVQVVYLADC